MELFIIIFTLLITLPLTFSFFLRAAIYCISFYLRKRYSIGITVAKCGLLSFRTIVIEIPIYTKPCLTHYRQNENEEEQDSQNPHNEAKNLSITIDQLRLSSSHLDNSCTAPLSISVSNIVIKVPNNRNSHLPIKIGRLDFPMDKIRGDFLKHYKENFNLTLCDIVIVLENFSYQIEKISLVKSHEAQKNLSLDLSRVIVSDLSIPEVEQFSNEMPRELTNQRILFVEQVQLSYLVGYNRNLNVTILGDFFLQWNLEFHLSIMSLIDIIKSRIPSKSDTKSNDLVTSSNVRSSEPPLSVKLNLDGRLSLGAAISEEQTVCINTDTLEVNASFPGPKTMRSRLLHIHFDEHTIVTCSMASVSHYPSPGITFILDRNQNSCGIKLSDPSNSLLCVDIENVELSFPYKYNFSDAFNEKLMGLFKWVKLYHKKVGPSQDRPIDFDINLRIKKFSFEIGDDPFEMKLRNNYMLLEDEYHEQLKRDQTLQDKLNELKRTNLMLASSIVEELNRALAKKNSDIYIQRSRQLYSSDKKQSPLFKVVIEEPDLKILADSSFHRHEDIMSIIRALNPDSPLANDVSFTTIWCRVISADFKSAEVFLRDFPIPMLSIKDLTVKGQIVSTEQVAVPRARRTCHVYVGRTSDMKSVERSMMPMKIFHNLQFRCATFNYTHGPCWDPVLSQVSISFEDIISSSRDPSPPLPWWDKMRFIIHGQARLNCNQLSVVLHASNDPYNQTEMIELSLSRSLIDWQGDKLKIKGDFDALLHTASKYDECRFIHLPNLDSTVTFEWICLGNPNDHHSIMPCAPDKVPDYSSYHNHDSYRSFRSQNLNLSLVIETQYTSPTISFNPENMPSMLFFGSTIRWLENQKFIFVGPSKLTRRGVLFNNSRPKKQSFSRIFKDVRLTVSLNRIQVLYWSSVSKRHGIQIIGGELAHSSEHTLKLVNNTTDNLVHRPIADWRTVYMKTDLSNVDLWLYNLTFEDLDEFNEFNVQTDIKNRQYFISFGRISYNRVAQIKDTEEDFELSEQSDRGLSALTTELQSNLDEEEVPNHRLVIHDLKAAWTKDNRDVVIGIYDAFTNSRQLKRNLSTEALKPIRIETQTPQPPASQSGQNPHRHQRHPSTTSLMNANIIPNPVSSVSKNRAVSMLQKLIADSENNPNVYTEETHSGVSSETHLYGVEACQMDDVVEVNCQIELINSQVVLRGTETPGYVIVSAAQTEIRQATHLPVWKNRTLLSKTSWTGSLQCMQYYATVDGHAQAHDCRTIFTDKNDIQWLDPDNIDSKSVINDLTDIVGSGHSVGGVVSSIVGKLSGSNNEDPEETSVELQRIISRCNCLFYYASHAAGVSEELQHLIPPLPDDEMFIEPWDKEVGVDSFTLTHQDLEISTNSQQYAMIMDIINNLLLYVEPHKKSAFEKLERMRFRFQLSADEDQRVPISQLQDQVRKYVSYLKRLERERYLVYRASIDDSMMPESDHDYRSSLDTLSCEIQNVKEQLNSASEELAMMISCYKETQLGAHKAQKQQAATQDGIGAFFANVIKRNEICFQSARWRVTDSDGQLGLADIVLNNFLYSKVVKSDDSVEHTIELGHLKVSNLIPNQAYKDVLHPTELQANIPLDRQRALRVYCRELAPVGGIPVKEHLELNVVPFTMQITLQFFQKMVKFFFPEKDSIKEDKSKRSNVLEVHTEGQLGRFGSKRKAKDKEKNTNSDILSLASSTGSSRGTPSSTALSSNGSRNVDTDSILSTNTVGSVTTMSTVSSLHSSSNQRRGEEIEKMRERASKNHTFVYVKIPGIPIKVSYKGKKQKNVTDLKNLSLTLPTFEYHNSTWTWLDLLMAVKNDSKHTVIKQALKQKMKIRPSSIWSKSVSNNQDQATLEVIESSNREGRAPIPVTDEDKARLLLGQYAKKWRTDTASDASPNV